MSCGQSFSASQCAYRSRSRRWGHAKCLGACPQRSWTCSHPNPLPAPKMHFTARGGTGGTVTNFSPVSLVHWSYPTCVVHTVHTPYTHCTDTVHTSRAGRVALVVTLPVPNSMLQYLMPWRSRSGTKPPRAYGSPIIFRVSSPPAAIVARVFSVPPEAVLAEMKCQNV
jgi:hypothetical protein